MEHVHFQALFSSHHSCRSFSTSLASFKNWKTASQYPSVGLESKRKDWGISTVKNDPTALVLESRQSEQCLQLHTGRWVVDKNVYSAITYANNSLIPLLVFLVLQWDQLKFTHKIIELSRSTERFSYGCYRGKAQTIHCVNHFDEKKTKLTNYNSNLNRVGRAKRGKVPILVLRLIGRENQFLRFDWLRVCVTRFSFNQLESLPNTNLKHTARTIFNCVS